MTMDDTYVQPCLQESEQWPQIYERIERQRSRLEEFAYFEKEVEARAEARRSMTPSLPKCEVDERTQMHGLCQHGKAPSIMEHGVAEQVDYAKLSRRHRQKYSNAPLMPLNMLVARPVSRSECIGNTKAMEAYWKELTNFGKNRHGAGRR